MRQSIAECDRVNGPVFENDVVYDTAEKRIKDLRRDGSTQRLKADVVSVSEFLGEYEVACLGDKFIISDRLLQAAFRCQERQLVFDFFQGVRKLNLLSEVFGFRHGFFGIEEKFVQTVNSSF